MALDQTWFAHMQARAFHKDSESGLNSKMAIGTYESFPQNTAEWLFPDNLTSSA